MMTLYDKNETTFAHNGLGILDETVISPVVHEELNGLFSLSFDFPIHAPKANLLQPEAIVKAPVPNQQAQLFRIVERSDALGGVFHIVAHHIFYDLAKNLIEDTYIVNKNGSQALSQLLSATQFVHKFSSTSNISTVNNARLVRINPVEVLLDSDLDNGFLSRWGGEIVRDNFTISLLNKRGSDNGVQIRDKKNLMGYQSNIDYSTVATRIMPEGYDGLFLPEKYVDSPLINNYTSPKIKVIQYDHVKVGTEEGEYATKELAYQALRTLAQIEFSVNNIDKPAASYEVTFAPLEKTEEYKEFSSLETVNMGDMVTVIHEDDVLNVSARMIAYDYNPATESYISVTLGNVLPKFTDVVKDIKKVDSKVTQALEDANVALSSANGKNTNYYGTATPNNPKLGDVWYKENGEKLEMWVYEMREGVTQWFPLMTDLTQEEVKQAVNLAKQESAQALENANTAYDQAMNALSQAGQVSSQVQNLNTQVTQNTSQISLTATGLTNLTNRVSTAEATLTVQAGQITSKASQNSVDNLTGRVTTAENTIIQNNTTLLVKISETTDRIGVPYLVKTWQQGSLSTTDGSEVSASNYLRSDFLKVNTGEKYIAQFPDGTAVTMVAHYYGFNLPYVDFIPSAKQYTETLTTGSYINATIASYLLSKNVESLNITATLITNPYTSSGDYLTIYKLPLGGKVVPQTLSWTGRKDTSDNTVWLYTGGTWQQIATITSGTQATYEWTLTTEQQAGITGDNIYLAFFSIKNGSYAGIYNATTTPFVLNPSSDSSLIQLSSTSSSSSVTVPSGAVKMRVRVNTTTKPESYQGNVFLASNRQDYTKTLSVYASFLMTKDLINLRVAKDDVINQINISTESILIAGNKVHITGTTTIDNAVISSAMIMDLAITNAKIADATIASAKIASLDAGKITTGTLNAARIAANSITADKMSANILTALTASSAIRITGTTIGYYENDTLVTQINSQGMTIRRGGTTVGTIGANNIIGHTDWRGLVFDLEYGTEYMAWASLASSTASGYTTKLIWYARTLENGKQQGFHFSDTVYLNGEFGIAYSDGSSNRAKISSTSFGDTTRHMTIQTVQGGAGLAFAGTNLMVGDDGVWVDFGIIRAICQKLAGRTIALPTGFNSNGTATGWYSPQAFNTMTTYS